MSSLPISGAISDDMIEIIEKGGVVISNEKIINVGDFEFLSKKENEVIEINKPQVLLPGFIDCHTHVCHFGTRSDEYSKRNAGVSYQKILSEGGGIHNTMYATQKASDNDLLNVTIKRLDRHFKEGVLTCEVKSGYGSNLSEELRLLSLINQLNDKHIIDVVPTCLAAHVTPKQYSSSSEYLEKIIEELIPNIKKNKLTERIDIFTEEKAFSIDE